MNAWRGFWGEMKELGFSHEDIHQMLREVGYDLTWADENGTRESVLALGMSPDELADHLGELHDPVT